MKNRIHLKSAIVHYILILEFFFIQSCTVGNSQNEYQISWTGDSVAFNDFERRRLILDSLDVIAYDDTLLNRPYALSWIGDTALVFANEGFGKVLGRVGNVSDSENYGVYLLDDRLHVDQVSQIIPLDSSVWLLDRVNQLLERVQIVNDKGVCGVASEGVIFPDDEFQRIVPLPAGRFAILPNNEKGKRLIVCDSSFVRLSESCFFPPVYSECDNNSIVQSLIDVSPSGLYIVVASLSWDFIEIYEPSGVLKKVMRGPLFVNTINRQQRIGDFERHIVESTIQAFSCLQVADSGFAIGVVDKPICELKSDNIISKILLFNRDGDPYLLLETDSLISDFDVNWNSGVVVIHRGGIDNSFYSYNFKDHEN